MRVFFVKIKNKSGFLFCFLIFLILVEKINLIRDL